MHAPRVHRHFKLDRGLLQHDGRTRLRLRTHLEGIPGTNFYKKNSFTTLDGFVNFDIWGDYHSPDRPALVPMVWFQWYGSSDMFPMILFQWHSANGTVQWYCSKGIMPVAKCQLRTCLKFCCIIRRVISCGKKRFLVLFPEWYKTQPEGSAWTDLPEGLSLVFGLSH